MPKKQPEQTEQPISPEEEVLELLEEVEALDPVVEELKQCKEQLLRLAAEYDNYKRRSQREREEAWLNAKAELFKAFLPVMDNFERACGEQSSVALSDQGFSEYRKGVEMIFAQFAGVFAQNEVVAFGEPGEPFDPVCHNAVTHMEDKEFDGENAVVAVFSKGYRLKDKVIREAMVGVVN